MRYREAYKIGSVCDGMIQCTFATIYDETGRGLFSLQRIHAQKGVYYKTDDGNWNDETTWNDAIITQLSPNLYFASYQHKDINAGDAELRGGVTFDFPLVTINEISNKRLVPAYLTDEAIELIQQACENMRVTKYTIYRVLDNVNLTDQTVLPGDMAITSDELTMTGDKRLKVRKRPDDRVMYNGNMYVKGEDGKYRHKIAEQYYAPNTNVLQGNATADYHYEVETENVISPKYQRLSEILEQRETVYIKPDAFDWQPADCANAEIVVTENGKTYSVKLTDRIEEARKKVKQAETLLYAAATTILL